MKAGPTGLPLRSMTGQRASLIGRERHQTPMSFSTGATALPFGAQTGTQAFTRGATLGLATALLAAAYQLVQEETRIAIHNLRARSRYRRARHESLLMVALGSHLPPLIQDRLLYSRDAFRVALEMLADPTVSDADKELIRHFLMEIHGSRDD
jgi:hypothetical protein